ncbi:MAG: hypothetical protein V2A66_08365 [Pseudomonadota bacterium]
MTGGSGPFDVCKKTYSSPADEDKRSYCEEQMEKFEHDTKSGGKFEFESCDGKFNRSFSTKGEFASQLPSIIKLFGACQVPTKARTKIKNLYGIPVIGADELQKSIDSADKVVIVAADLSDKGLKKNLDKVKKDNSEACLFIVEKDSSLLSKLAQRGVPQERAADKLDQAGPSVFSFELISGSMKFRDDADKEPEAPQKADKAAAAEKPPAAKPAKKMYGIPVIGPDEIEESIKSANKVVIIAADLSDRGLKKYLDQVRIDNPDASRFIVEKDPILLSKFAPRGVPNERTAEKLDQAGPAKFSFEASFGTRKFKDDAVQKPETPQKDAAAAKPPAAKPPKIDKAAAKKLKEELGAVDKMIAEQERKAKALAIDPRHLDAMSTVFAVLDDAYNRLRDMQTQNDEEFQQVLAAKQKRSDVRSRMLKDIDGKIEKYFKTAKIFEDGAIQAAQDAGKVNLELEQARKFVEAYLGHIEEGDSESVKAHAHFLKATVLKAVFQGTGKEGDKDAALAAFNDAAKLNEKTGNADDKKNWGEMIARGQAKINELWDRKTSRKVVMFTDIKSAGDLERYILKSSGNVLVVIEEEDRDKEAKNQKIMAKLDDRLINKKDIGGKLDVEAIYVPLKLKGKLADLPHVQLSGRAFLICTGSAGNRHCEDFDIREALVSHSEVPDAEFPPAGPTAPALKPEQAFKPGVVELTLDNYKNEWKSSVTVFVTGAFFREEDFVKLVNNTEPTKDKAGNRGMIAVVDISSKRGRQIANRLGILMPQPTAKYAKIQFEGDIKDGRFVGIEAPIEVPDVDVEELIKKHGETTDENGFCYIDYRHFGAHFGPGAGDAFVIVGDPTDTQAGDLTYRLYSEGRDLQIKRRYFFIPHMPERHDGATLQSLRRGFLRKLGIEPREIESKKAKYHIYKVAQHGGRWKAQTYKPVGFVEVANSEAAGAIYNTDERVIVFVAPTEGAGKEKTSELRRRLVALEDKQVENGKPLVPLVFVDSVNWPGVNRGGAEVPDQPKIYLFSGPKGATRQMVDVNIAKLLGLAPQDKTEPRSPVPAAGTPSPKPTAPAAPPAPPPTKPSVAPAPPAAATPALRPTVPVAPPAKNAPVAQLPHVAPPPPPKPPAPVPAPVVPKPPPPPLTEAERNEKAKKEVLEEVRASLDGVKKAVHARNYKSVIDCIKSAKGLVIRYGGLQPSDEQKKWANERDREIDEARDKALKTFTDEAKVTFKRFSSDAKKSKSIAEQERLISTLEGIIRIASELEMKDKKKEAEAKLLAARADLGWSYTSQSDDDKEKEIKALEEFRGLHPDFIQSSACQGRLYFAMGVGYYDKATASYQKFFRDMESPSFSATASTIRAKAPSFVASAHYYLARSFEEEARLNDLRDIKIRDIKSALEEYGKITLEELRGPADRNRRGEVKGAIKRLTGELGKLSQWSKGDSAVIFQRLRDELKKEFSYCYERFLKRNPDFAATGSLKYTVDPSGDVGCKVGEGTEGDSKEFGERLCQIARRKKLPRGLVKKSEVSDDISFTFQPAR